LATLRKKGFIATGTVRENRIRICNLKSIKVLEKECKGSFDFSFDKKNEICAVRWNDNSVVMIMKNNGKMYPLVVAKLYNRKEKRTLNVQQPNVIQDYN